MSRGSWQIFLASSLCMKSQKKYKWIYEPTWGPTPWPEVPIGSWKVMFSACVSPGLYLAEWTRHNVELSYFIASHTVHLSGSRLKLTSRLAPVQVPVLLQLWSEVVKRTLPDVCGELSMSDTCKKNVKRSTSQVEDVPPWQNCTRASARQIVGLVLHMHMHV